MKKEYKRKDFPSLSYLDFLGKRRIIFIQDGWGPTDHIDVWNGYNMKAGEAAYFSKGLAIWFWRYNNDVKLFKPQYKHDNTKTSK